MCALVFFPGKESFFLSRNHFFMSRNHFILGTEELFFLTRIALSFKGNIFSCQGIIFSCQGIIFPWYRWFFSSQGFLYTLKDFSLKWIFSQLWFSWQVILSLKRHYYPYKEWFFLQGIDYLDMDWFILPRKLYLIRNTNCKFD